MRALITGGTGQDSSYLAEFLYAKGYEVFVTARRVSSDTFGRIDHLIAANKLTVLSADMLDQQSLTKVLRQSRPHEVYNLAAQSFVGTSWRQPTLTSEVTAIGCLRLLEAVRDYDPTIKMYQASSSEMFGNEPAPQNEMTPFKPRSPYGVAKLFAHMMCHNYVISYNMFISCGILFNHESPRRGEDFVTQKVARTLALIKLGLRDRLALGNIRAKRDWGHAKDYVEAMWMMLQQKHPDDFVIASGVSRTVEEFLERCLEYFKLPSSVYYIDEKFMRPAEIECLLGDSSKAKKILGWTPKIKFDDLVLEMCQEAEKYAQRLKLLIESGVH